MDETMTGEKEVGLVESKSESRYAGAVKKIREFAKKIGARNLVIAGSLMLIGAAVILNFALFGGSASTVGEGDLLGSGLLDDADEVQSYEEENAYFASAQLSRKQARDQALAVLQTVVESASADAIAKEQASEDISRIASEIQTESNVETLIKSKCFEDCVAVIAEGSASIIVRSDGLLPNELSQIKEIVYEQAGIDPISIKIIEQSGK